MGGACHLKSLVLSGRWASCVPGQQKGLAPRAGASAQGGGAPVGPRVGDGADGGEAAVVQRAVRQARRAQQRPHVAVAPAQHRVDAHEGRPARAAGAERVLALRIGVPPAPVGKCDRALSMKGGQPALLGQNASWPSALGSPLRQLKKVIGPSA